MKFARVGLRRAVLVGLAGFCLTLCSPAYGVQDMTIFRPGPKDQPTKVEVGVFLVDLDSINTAEQSITANVFVILRWRDPRQADPEAGFRDMSLDEVWDPRVQIVNRQRAWETLPQTVRVSPEGEVVYRQRYYGNFSTPLHLTDFPFDSHTFEIQLAAVGYTEKDLQFEAIKEFKEFGRADKLSIADWDFKSWQAGPSPYSPIKGDRSVAGYVYSFRAKRYLGFFIVKIFAPLIFIVLMSWLVFWIDPIQVGSQISVAVTAMLTLIAYQFLLGGLLPKISYLTRMDVFLVSSTFLVFAALVEVVCTSHLATTERVNRARKIDLVSRVVFPLFFLIVIVLTIWA